MGFTVNDIKHFSLYVLVFFQKWQKMDSGLRIASIRTELCRRWNWHHNQCRVLVMYQHHNQQF